MRSTRAVPTVRMLTVRTLIVKRPTARRLDGQEADSKTDKKSKKRDRKSK